MVLVAPTSTPAASALINSGSSSDPCQVVSAQHVEQPCADQLHVRAALRHHRRILAAVFPDLLNELVSQRIQPAQSTLQESPEELSSSGFFRATPFGSNASQKPAEQAPGSTVAASRAELLHTDPPRAVVLTDPSQLPLNPKHELDAVNSIAHRLGVRVHQSIAQASAIVECLRIHSLPRSEVLAALKKISEVALAFGSPVSFQLPDTVWVDISGSSHLFGSEYDLAVELKARIRGLHHVVRIAIASGPWLAQSFAKYCDHDESGIRIINSVNAEHAVARLPIIALPLQRDSVAWLSRLGLLTLEDLRALPTSTLASRIEEPSILELIRGRDETLLLPFRPEEKPCEEQFWEDAIENIEPLLFVLRGLVSRLSARLEGRGQAVQELSLVIHYDRSIGDRTISTHAAGRLESRAAGRRLRPTNPEPRATADLSNARSSPNEISLERRTLEEKSLGKGYASLPVEPAVLAPGASTAPDVLELSFKFAAPLVHSDELERILRLRLQRQSLLAPSIGISLRASSVTDATPDQLRLANTSGGSTAGWSSDIVPDPRRIAILAAELSEDVGEHAVGRLVTRDSHLPEENSRLSSISNLPRTLTREAETPLGASREKVESQNDRSQVVGLEGRSSEGCSSEGCSSEGRGSQDYVQQSPQLPRIPTRIFIPSLEVHAPIRKDELWMVREQPFVVHQIHFEQRLEEVEWWHSSSIFRDYFRVWLIAVDRAPADSRAGKPLHGFTRRPASSGIEVLAYRDRRRDCAFIQALYD